MVMVKRGYTSNSIQFRGFFLVQYLQDPEIPYAMEITMVNGKIN